MDVLNLNTGEHGVIDVPCTSGSGGVGEACGGQVSSYTLAVLPGMRYRAFLVATNVDGSANTSHVEFRSEIGRKCNFLFFVFVFVFFCDC